MKSKSKNQDCKYDRKNQKGKFQGKRGNFKRTEEGETLSRTNDWRWYAENEQLLRDSASFSYSYPLGNRIDLGEYGAQVNRTAVPGVMAIHTAPTFGYADNPVSPINVCARNIYTYVRHANSGSKNYDSIDLMQYLMAMDSAISYHAFLKRIYGVLQTYSFTNRYYPKAVIRAMGIDFDDIYENIADFRALINTYAIRVGQMAIPAHMSYMAKHKWMYEGLYADNPTSKAQTYMFVPEGFYFFELDEDSAGMLQFVKMSDWYRTHHDVSTEDLEVAFKYSDLRAFAEELIAPILRREDLNIMSGDILKAYNEGGVYRLEGIAENYSVVPVYDPVVLDQIENATLLGTITDLSSWTLKQDSTKGYLIHMPKFTHQYEFAFTTAEAPGKNALLMNRLINFDREDVTPAMTMEATRLTNIVDEYYGKDEANDQISFTSKTIGSEVALYAVIYYYGYDININNDLPTSDYILRHTKPITTSMVDLVQWDNQQLTDVGDITTYVTEAGRRFNFVLQQISQFARHPGIIITSAAAHYSSTNSTTRTVSYGHANGILMDINYYTVVDANDLEQMTSTALMSEFGVKQYGKA